jgi:hypothetical protein
MEDVAKTTVFITDIKYREAVGRVRTVRDQRERRLAVP